MHLDFRKLNREFRNSYTWQLKRSTRHKRYKPQSKWKQCQWWVTPSHPFAVQALHLPDYLGRNKRLFFPQPGNGQRFHLPSADCPQHSRQKRSACQHIPHPPPDMCSVLPDNRKWLYNHRYPEKKIRAHRLHWFAQMPKTNTKQPPAPTPARMLSIFFLLYFILEFTYSFKLKNQLDRDSIHRKNFFPR